MTELTYWLIGLGTVAIVLWLVDVTEAYYKKNKKP
jgi:uncharacterized membrane protein YuzA (DUF378 family)